MGVRVQLEGNVGVGGGWGNVKAGVRVRLEGNVGVGKRHLTGGERRSRETGAFD